MVVVVSKKRRFGMDAHFEPLQGGRTNASSLFAMTSVVNGMCKT